MKYLLLSAALLCALFAACGGDDDDSSPTAGASNTPSTGTATSVPGSPTVGASPTPAFTGTTGPTEKQVATGQAELAVVRAASQAGFDRITFEFSGNTLPGYQIDYVTPPTTQCASGMGVTIGGQALLLVKFRPARAHTEAGQATVTERELKPALPTIVEAEQTCDFEGLVSWGVGVSAKKGYRVTELQNPSRIVVDILH
jgi:hypothetical protein